MFIYKILVRIRKEKLRLLKSYSFLKLGNAYVVDAPQPSNLSYL
jgi:hypothetical protein